MQRRDSLFFELLVNFLLVIGPLGLIGEGLIGVWQNDPAYPDAFVQFGGLMMGVISLITLLAYLIFWLWGGRGRVPGYRKALWGFYLIWTVVGIWLALLTLGVVAPSGIWRSFY